MGAPPSLNFRFLPFRQLSSLRFSPHGPGFLPAFSYISGPIFLLFIHLILPHRTWTLGWPRKNSMCKVVERKKLRRQKWKPFSGWNLKMLIFIFAHCHTCGATCQPARAMWAVASGSWGGAMFLFFFLNSNTVDLQYYIKFMCTTVIQYFDRLYSI